MALSSIQEILDRSLFSAISRVCIENGYSPDRGDYDFNTEQGQIEFSNALDLCQTNKGFSIEVISHSNSQYKGNKDIARIVIDPYGFIPGETGLDSSINHVKNEDGSFSRCNMPNQSSEYEVNVHVVGKTAEQIRVLNSIIAVALQRKGYIPKFPETSIQKSGNFFYENTGSFDSSDRSEGVIEKIYRFLFKEIYEIDPIIDEESSIAALASIELETKVCQLIFNDLDIIDPTQCAAVQIFDHLGNKLADVPSGGDYTISNPNSEIGTFQIREINGDVYDEVLQGPGAFWTNESVVLRDYLGNIIKDDFDISEIYNLPATRIEDEESILIAEAAPGELVIIPSVGIFRPKGAGKLITLKPGEQYTLSGVIVNDYLGNPLFLLEDGEQVNLTSSKIYEDLDGQGTQGDLIAELSPGESFIVPPSGPTQSGIEYSIITPTPNQQYRIGDPYWHLLNGTYDRSKNECPQTYPEIDFSATQNDVRPGSPATGTIGTDNIAPTMLKENNAFGNKYLWTDDQGNPSNAPVGSNIWAHTDWVNHDWALSGSTPGYVINHLYGLGVQVIHALGPNNESGLDSSGGMNWESWVDHAHNTYGNGPYTAGNSGWRLGSLEEYVALGFGRYAVAGTYLDSIHWVGRMFLGNFTGSTSTRFSLITGNTLDSFTTAFISLTDSNNTTMGGILAKAVSSGFASRIASFHPIRNHRL